jgi:hypothetical protein
MIRLILLIGVAIVVLIPLYGKKTESIRALEKLAFVALIVAGLFFLASPEFTTTIANLIDVGRGTDLMVYMLTVVVMYMAASFYIEVKRSASREATLVQELAILSGKVSALRKEIERLDRNGDAG